MTTPQETPDLLCDLIITHKTAINTLDFRFEPFVKALDTITAETSDETVAAIKISAQDCVTKIKAPNITNQGITLERVLLCMTFAIKKHNK